jgi:flagellar biosynthetic protein FliO
MPPLLKILVITLWLPAYAGLPALAQQPAPTEQQAEPVLNAETAPAAEKEEQTATEAPADPAAQAQAAELPATATKPEPQGRPFQLTSPPAERSNSSGLSLGKIAISLTAVLLLVVVLGWLFKKLTMRLPGSQHIKVICSVAIGQRERLLVIEIQGKQRVLGVTPQSINMLFELENSLPDTKLASDFHTQLQSFLKK